MRVRTQTPFPLCQESGRLLDFLSLLFEKGKTSDEGDCFAMHVRDPAVGQINYRPFPRDIYQRDKDVYRQ